MKQTNHPFTPAIHRGVLLLALGLSGCGGGDEGEATSPLPPPVTSTVTVLDGFSTATPDTPTRLDLSPFVRGVGAELTAISSTQPGCVVSTPSGFNADVTIQGGGLCSYKFSARIGDGPETSANLNVLASRASEPVLTPLSHALTLDQPAPVFDLQAELGAEWPAGHYTLDASSVKVQGGSVQGSATVSGNSITFTPPLGEDWNRIVFVLKDPAEPMKDVMGSIYVTISATANGAPTIALPKYDYQANNPGTQIDTFDSVKLDLGTLPNLGIQDPDGDEWQLIEVQSYSASVQSANPSDTSNKVFTFSAATVGEHIVSYIVGDHRGGFRMGLMSIKVEPKEQAKNWVDIDLSAQLIRFSAPPLYSQLKRGVSPEFIIEPVWDTGVNSGTGNTIGAAGNIAAGAYCTGKRVPTRAELDVLRTATGMAAMERAKYPQGRPYLISDTAGTQFQTYNLSSGAVSAYTPGVTPNPYVMCVVSQGDFTVDYSATPNTPFTGMTNTVISNGNWQAIGTVTSKGGTTPDSPTLFGSPSNEGTGSLAAANFRLNPQGCENESCSLEAKGASNEYGSATAQIANNKVTSKTVNVPVTFLQDAKVTMANVTVDNAMADGTSANVIKLTLKDNAGNPVPVGTPVKLDYSVTTSPSFSPVINPAPKTTVNLAADGMVVMLVKSKTEGSVTLHNPAVEHGLPLIPTSTTVKFAPSKGIPGFTKPDTLLRTWVQADLFCKGLTPAARLPKTTELQDVFLKYTSSEEIGEGTKEMCEIYGWPLRDKCGGRRDEYWASESAEGGSYHYNIDMENGKSYDNENSSEHHVVCVRE